MRSITFSRGWLLRAEPLLSTVSQIILYSGSKLGAQLGHGIGVKADDVAHTQHSADEDVVTLIKLDSSRIALIGHAVHSSTPAR
jgi:hypothetical protein